MSGELLPIFPLSTVLLPGMPLPLHIFEERYKEMMADLERSSNRFGVVLARDEGVVSVGCVARVDRIVTRYEDGQLDIVTNGAERFEIESMDQDKSYLRARVSFFDDEDLSEPSADLKKRALAAYRGLQELEEVEEAGLPGARLSFRMGQLLHDLDKQQSLLGIRSESERLLYLLKTMPAYVARQQRTVLAKRVAPQNGHAKGL